MTLLQRVFREKRTAVVALGVAIALNLAAYVLVVRPLEAKSAGAADRAAVAADALKRAETEYAAARGLVSGKARAEQELSTFYSKVIPPDLSAARRMTYATLPALARRVNVKYEQRRVEVEATGNAKSRQLGHLQIRMVLQGDYDAVRRFIYELETAPQFVIIDGVTLSQNDATKPLTLLLDLSTYYRLDANGG